MVINPFSPRRNFFDGFQKKGIAHPVLFFEPVDQFEWLF